MYKMSSENITTHTLQGL